MYSNLGSKNFPGEDIPALTSKKVQFHPHRQLLDPPLKVCAAYLQVLCKFLVCMLYHICNNCIRCALTLKSTMC